MANPFAIEDNIASASCSNRFGFVQSLPSVLRWLVVLCLASVVTLALFSMMAWMVSNSDEVETPQTNGQYQMVMVDAPASDSPSQRQLPKTPEAMKPEAKPEVQAKPQPQPVSKPISKPEPKPIAKPTSTKSTVSTPAQPTTPKQATPTAISSAPSTSSSSATKAEASASSANSAPTGESRNAQAISRSEPEYPARMRQRKIEGYVVVSFVINEQGRTENIQVVDVNPNRAFANPAISAVKRWQFKPKLVNGVAVKQQEQIKIEFKLD